MKVTVAVVSALAVLLWAQLGAPAHARGHGKGAHHLHFGKHAHHHFRNKQFWPWWYWYGYGGVYPDQSYASNDISTPAIMYVPVSTNARSCPKVQEAVTVPSEQGGTRQVTVTRCEAR